MHARPLTHETMQSIITRKRVKWYAFEMGKKRWKRWFGLGKCYYTRTTDTDYWDRLYLLAWNVFKHSPSYNGMRKMLYGMAAPEYLGCTIRSMLSRKPRAGLKRASRANYRKTYSNCLCPSAYQRLYTTSIERLIKRIGSEIQSLQVQE